MLCFRSFAFVKVFFLLFTLGSPIAMGAVELSINGGADYDFGDVIVGKTSTQTLTLQNVGTVQLKDMDGDADGDFSFVGGNYPGTGGSCGDKLNVGQSCSVVVSFKPDQNGSTSKKLEFFFDGKKKNEKENIKVTGNGVDPAQITNNESPSYSFGNVTQNTTETKVFTFKNNGDVSATNLNVTLSGSMFSMTNSCGATLAKNATCTVSVTYAPTTVGNHSGNLSVTYHNGKCNKSLSIAMSGKGIAPPPMANIVISDAPAYSYGDVEPGLTASKVFTVSNIGNATASWVTRNLSGTGFSITSQTCGFWLSAGSSCSVTIRFAPTAVATYSGTFTVNYYNSEDSTSSSISLMGAGVMPPTPAVVAPDEDSHDFGSIEINQTTTRTFMFTNTGVSNASSMTFVVTGTGFSITGNTCTAALAPNNSCFLMVQFAPMVVGTYAGMVSFSYGDGYTTQSMNIALSGTATEPPPVPADIAVNYSREFGDVEVGSTAQQNFFLTNVTTGQATNLVTTVTGNGFSVAQNNCSSALNAESSCSVVVAFAPTSVGEHTGLFVVEFFDGLQNQSVTVSMVGNGIAPPTPPLENCTEGPMAAITPITGGNGMATSIALQADGKFVVAGTFETTSSSRAYVMRFMNDHTLDLTFNATGVVFLALGSRGLAVTMQSNQILVAGTYHSTSKDMFVARINSDGTMDDTFGTQGSVTIDINGEDDEARSIAAQNDGMIVSGYTTSQGQKDFAIIRLNMSGALDGQFGVNGVSSVDFAGDDDEIYSMSLQSDGKIVAAGYSTNSNRKAFSLVRLLSNGSPDTTFKGTSTVVTNIGSDASEVMAMTIQTNGRIVVAGSSYLSGQSVFTLARYLSNGNLDSTFNGSGIARIDVLGQNAWAQVVGADSAGRIITGGSVENGGPNRMVAVTRHTPSGGLDPNWGIQDPPYGDNSVVAFNVVPGNDERVMGMIMLPNDAYLMVGTTTSGNQTHMMTGCMD